MPFSDCRSSGTDSRSIWHTNSVVQRYPHSWPRESSISSVAALTASSQRFQPTAAAFESPFFGINLLAEHESIQYNAVHYGYSFDYSCRSYRCAIAKLLMPGKDPG